MHDQCFDAPGAGDNALDATRRLGGFHHGVRSELLELFG